MFLIGFMTVAFIYQNQSPQTSRTQASEQQAMQQTGISNYGSVQASQYDISVYPDRVTPQSITVKHCDDVVLNVLAVNTDSEMHYSGFGINEFVSSGQTKAIAFAACGVGENIVDFGNGRFFTVFVEDKMDEEPGV